MENSAISWDKIALKSFVVAIEFIAKESFQNAEKVRLEIINEIEAIPANPRKFPPDRFKHNNDGLYRAFEIHHYRITYYIAPDKIRIIRIRHTSREPKTY